MYTWNLAVTRRDRRSCYRLRAAAYGRLYNNVPEGEFQDELDDARLPDGHPQSSLVLVRGPHGVAGTMRVAAVERPGHRGLRSEVDFLMDFDPRELAEIIDRARAPGAPPAPVGELGRMAIARDGEVREAMRATLSAVGQAARLRELPVLIWIMAPFVDRRFRDLGVRAHRVQSAQLRRDSLENLQYILTYHDYFLSALGNRGLQIDPERLAQGADPRTLRALVSDCPDGTHMFWLKTHDFVEALPPCPLAPARRGARAAGGGSRQVP